jgi:hypothetical protein
VRWQGDRLVKSHDDPLEALHAGSVCFAVDLSEVHEIRDDLSTTEVIKVGGAEMEVGGQRGQVGPQCPPQVWGSATTLR